MEEITFDELFAIRIQYHDYILDEHTLIKKLKLLLINSYNYSIEEANNYLVDFYNTYLPQSNITYDIINNIPVSILNQNIFYNLLNTINIPQENIPQENIPHENIPQENISNILPDIPVQHSNIIPDIPAQHSNIIFQYSFPNTINFTNNQLSSIQNAINVLQNTIQPSYDEELEDVLVTLDDNSLDNLKVKKIEKDMNEKCSICMVKIVKDDEVFDLKCKHLFHTDCMKIYLEEYGYKCPVCRVELGKTKIHN